MFELEGKTLELIAYVNFEKGIEKLVLAFFMQVLISQHNSNKIVINLSEWLKVINMRIYYGIFRWYNRIW